jgi:hypothetical protein
MVRPPVRIRAARNETPRIIFAYGRSRNLGDRVNEIEDGGSSKGVVSSGFRDGVDIMDMKGKLKVNEIEDRRQRWVHFLGDVNAGCVAAPIYESQVWHRR